MVCLMPNVLFTVVGLKLLSTALAICALVMIPAAVELMGRPEGLVPLFDVVGVAFDVVGVVDVVGVFEVEVAVAAIAVVVAFKDVTRLLPVCLRPW